MYRCKPDETKFVRGCALLHEAGHAKCTHDNGRVGLEEKEGITPSLLLEEVAMHSQDYQLWQERGGSSYANALKVAVDTIKDEYKRLKTNRAFIPFNINDQWAQVLETTLGSALTPKRKIARNWQFRIQAHFAYADQQPWSSDQKLEHKAMTLKLIYTNLVPEAGKNIT